MQSVVAALLVVFAARGQGLPVAQPQAVGLSPTALARIGPAMQAYLDSAKYAGAVLVIARHGKIGYIEALGYMDLQKKIPMRTDAVFRIASMTKPLIAAAILKLVDTGKVRLDDPVVQYIPAFANMRGSESSGELLATFRSLKRPITIKDVLTHTSGLTITGGPTHSLTTLRAPERTLAQFADTVAKLPVTTSPREKWAYSSLGYDVLGRVIEVASGRTLDQYLDEEIFGPLRMQETSFHLTPAMEGRIPVVYSREKDGTLRPDAEFLAAAYLPTSRFLSGGGGLLSTPADYLRFTQMLLRRGKFEGKRTLSRASVAAMLGNHLSPSLTPIITPVFDHTGYGFGLGGAVLVDAPRSGEPGSPGLYRWAGSVQTFFWIDPKNGLNSPVVYPIPHRWLPDGAFFSASRLRGPRTVAEYAYAERLPICKYGGNEGLLALIKQSGIMRPPGVK